MKSNANGYDELGSERAPADDGGRGLLVHEALAAVTVCVLQWVETVKETWLVVGWVDTLSAAAAVLWLTGTLTVGVLRATSGTTWNSGVLGAPQAALLVIAAGRAGARATARAAS